MKKILMFSLLSLTMMSLAVPRPAELVDLTSPTGRASSNVAFYKGTAARVFQDDANLAGGDTVRVIFDKTKSGNMPACFAYTFEEAQVVNAYGLAIMSASTQLSARDPKDLMFFGSNDYDGNKANLATATWTKLDERNEADWLRGEYRYFAFENTNTYTSYMLVIGSGQSDSEQYLQFAYAEFFNDDLNTITGGSLVRRANGAWRAEAETKHPGEVYLNLEAEGCETVTLQAGDLSPEDLADVDKDIDYTASLKTISPSGQISTYRLPGLYHFGTYSSVAKDDYAKSVTIAVSDGFGEHKSGNLVLPVRLSEAGIKGFSYADFKLENGADLVFFDAYGNVVPHEIDTWNPEGESLVWVRFPVVESGTALTCCYGGPSAGDYAAQTWAGYAGVWHLGLIKDGTTYPNSTAAGSRADGAKASVSQAGAAGRFGASCYINDSGVKANSYTKGGIIIPHSEALKLEGSFTVSGWFKHKNQSYYYDRLFATRPKGGTAGFTVEVGNGWTTAGQIQIKGASTVFPKVAMTDLMMSDWGYCTFVFDGKRYSFYQNGALEWALDASGPVVDSGEPFVIGNVSFTDPDATADCSWCGWVDEVRIKTGVAQTADEIAWEYAVTANDGLVYGMAMDNQSTAVLMVAANREDMGSPSPAYGVHMSNEGITVVSAGSPVLIDDVVYEARAYTLETSSDGGLTWMSSGRHEGSTFDFVYNGELVRVTWLWEPVAAAVCVRVPQAGATIDFSTEPIATFEGVPYYPVGSTLTVTVDDERAESFREWLDAGPEVSAEGNVATISVGTRPVVIAAVMRYPWTYEDKVLTDGDWVLKATLSGNEVTVTGVERTSAIGVLDLTSAIRAAGSDQPLKVVAIETDAFKANETLRSVTVEEGFRKFGWRAFQNCTNLERFEPLLPDSVETIGGQVFENCAKLSGDLVIANEKCTDLQNKTFAQTAITSVALKHVGNMAGGSVFEYNPALKTADIRSVTNIGTRSFRGCTALESVSLGDGLTTLGSEAFVNCSALTSVTPMLPDSLTTFVTTVYNGTLNNGAFSGCTKLDVDVRMINPAVTDLYGQIFQNSGIRSLEIPHVTKVWKYALNNVPNFNRLVFGSSDVDLNDYCPIFNNGSDLEVFFPGAAPTLDITKDYRPFGNKNYIRIYGDPKMDPEGWAALMASDSFVELSDADRVRVDYPGPATIGLLTEAQGARYWLVAYRSPLRPKGTIIVVR